nr:immunoglobulin light chain junction region [Macaca mulatta]MOY05034.1 immunoglobulin light chain junction region [Macaca mulatta]MOY05059.1 immunoglobulin light chain junction region [Macaca mulatta]MOY05062.1 immunoglobulin light chain junction region [Macaca mulatta]MOY05098.1 immunoglobulin light chain junction region [Macaca mulatta]
DYYCQVWYTINKYVVF